MNTPNAMEILRLEGLAFAESGEMDAAIGCFSSALDINALDAALHNNLANAYKQKREFDLAIRHYEQALLLDPQYAQAHNNFASLLVQLGEHQRALQHFQQAVHTAPDFAVAHHNLGLLLLRIKEPDAAKRQFNNVIALNPHYLQAHFYLGVLALNADELDDAEKAFQHVLSVDKEHMDTLNNLGVIALKREQGQLAIDYFTKSLALDPNNWEARNNLAATFIHYDRFENALTHYAELLDHAPNEPEYLYNAGVAEMALGHLEKAKKYFQTILTQQAHHFAALTNLAAIQVRLGYRQQAITLLHQAHAANPDDTSCQFMLNALTGRTDTALACPDYARNLFDNYALYYDKHMQSTLHYSIPQHIARALHQHLKHSAPIARALDLGCGTGLSGVVLRELSTHLTGVDLSSKMLNQAKQKGIYDALTESEALAFLNQNTEPYDLIVAADVLPYLGDLKNLFQAVHAQLSPSGLWIFSVEISEQAPWQLQSSARFSHHPDYLRALSEQQHFNILHQERLIARKQDGHDLSVLLYVMQPTGAVDETESSMPL
jgi:predicted TPR repeat methyltransferase